MQAADKDRGRQADQIRKVCVFAERFVNRRHPVISDFYGQKHGMAATGTKAEEQPKLLLSASMTNATCYT